VRATKSNRKPLIAYTRGNKEGGHVSVQERDESVVRAYVRDRRREARAAQAGVKKIAWPRNRQTAAHTKIREEEMRWKA